MPGSTPPCRRERLQFLAERLTDIPADITLHPRVEKIMADRRAMGRGELALDWGMAENLAYATLLTEGYPVRLSGQDCGRGTFFHRHAVLHDQNRVNWQAGLYVPLRNLEEGQADVVVIDSILSEEAVLALRIRLCHRRARFADDLGGAIRRFRQWRASGDRPVHRLGRSQVGAPVRAGDAAAARLRRAGRGAFLRAHRALSAVVRRLQHPGMHPLHPGADVPPVAPPDAAPGAPAADRVHAQEPAAQQGCRLAAEMAGRGRRSSR